MYSRYALKLRLVWAFVNPCYQFGAQVRLRLCLFGIQRRCKTFVSIVRSYRLPAELVRHLGHSASVENASTNDLDEIKNTEADNQIRPDMIDENDVYVARPLGKLAHCGANHREYDVRLRNREFRANDEEESLSLVLPSLSFRRCIVTMALYIIVP